MSRIQVITYELVGLDYPVVCQNCEPAPCVELCPTGALSKGRAGGIELDKSKCIGCRVCSEICPYGAAMMDPKGRYPLICDMCGGNPACVAACPTNALSISGYAMVELPARSTAERFAVTELSKLAKGWGIEVRDDEGA